MKHIGSFLTALTVLTLSSLLFPAGLLAQSAGTVTGRVSNAGTGNYLAAVEVTDKATGRSVYTDAEGRYELFNLPAGERTLVYNYGGLDRQEATVSVTAGGRATKDIALTSADYDRELVVLEKFVVGGDREGRMASIAQQKASDVMVTMISSDEFPNVAGANLGDFLRNIPGLDIMDNGSDPREIMFRGMDPQMSGVTSDGLRMANSAGTDGSTRSFNLDQISIQNYETIEVFKTPTAAMSADSGAGSVNLVSKSAFNLKRARISFQAGGMLNSSNTHIMRTPSSSGSEFSIRPVGNFMYQNSFFGRRLGVTFTANFNDMATYSKSVTASRRTAYDSNASLGYNYPIGPDSGIFTRSMNYSTGPGVTRRTSVSLNFDYKLTPFIKLYTNNQINTSFITSGQQSFNTGNADPNVSNVIHVGGPVSGLLPDWSPYSVTAVTGANDIRANTIQDAAASKSSVNVRTGLEVLNKIGNGTMFSIGGEYKRDGWKINLDAGVSLSTNHYTTQRDKVISQATMYLNGIDYRIDQPAGSNYPVITQLNGPDMYDLSSYVSRATTSSPKENIPGTNRNLYENDVQVLIPGVSTNRTYPVVQKERGDYLPFHVSNGRWLATKDKFTTVKLDARRDFATRIPMYAQAGWLYREQERHTDKNGQSRWYFTGSTEELQEVLESVKSPTLNTTFGPYQPVPYFSLSYIDEYFKKNPGKFREDVYWRTETELAGDKFSRERIHGLYGMYNIRLGRLNTMLGARYEHTNQYGEARVADNEAVSVRAAGMLMDYVRQYGYADITSAYNDTSVHPVTGITGQSLVGNYTVTQEQALELARLRYANVSTVDRDFGDWFPNVQLKYYFTNSLIARASYNKAIARQAFDRLLPGYTVRTNSDGTYRDIIMNNPELEPVYFNNYDIALELYTKQGGSFSIGYYYKDVKNYIIQFAEDIVEGGNYPYDFSGYENMTLIYPMNSGGARHWGIEIAVSQQLGVISNHLRHLQIYAGYTYQDGWCSSSFNNNDTGNAITDPNYRRPYVPVTRLVPQKFKINLNYSRSSVNASLSYNWTGRYRDSIVSVASGFEPESYGYVWRDKRGTFDGTLQYTYYKNYRFYIEAKNITNEPVRTYLVNSKWTQGYNIYGTSIYFGVKGSF